jgi:excisionase family DNA binding protein
MASHEDLPPTITVERAAEMLGVSRQSAYTAVKRGEIPSISVGRRKVIPTAAFLKLLGLEQNIRFDQKAAV